MSKSEPIEGDVRHLLDHLDVVFYQTNSEGSWSYLSPAWERLTGFSVAECLGKPFLDYVDREDHTRALEGLSRLTDHGPQRTEVRLRHRHDGNRWVDAHLTLVNLPDEAGCGTAGTFRDVTDRRRAEEQLRLASAVFEHSLDGILVTDAHERILEVNEAFCRMTGYSREEVLGKTPRLLGSGRQTVAFYDRMWTQLQQAGHWQGEIWNRRKNGEVYAEWLTITAVRGTGGAVDHYVGIFSDLTQSKQFEQQLEAIAHYDALTGLPNRTLLGDRFTVALSHAQRTSRILGAAYLDLDGFRRINELMGPLAGDKLLLELAKRLKAGLRAGDTIARIGGDEFTVLLTDLDAIEEGEQAVLRLLETVSRPIDLDGAEVSITASIGVTFFPNDGGDPDSLLRHAHQAMYRAKELGRNRYQLFDPEHGRQMQIHRDVRLQIDEALERRELVLFYQPKVDMRTARVLGVEALLRWNHPERGLLGPGAFLPFIEDSDRIVQVGAWVLEEALRQMAEWHRHGLYLPVSVNVAPRQLQTPDFCVRLAALLEANPDLPPGCLQLEVLESTALDDMVRIGEIIQQCRELGVTVALDDFGLTYLKRIPADQLKIDKSFVGDMVGDPEARAIVEAVIGLAGAFQRTVIAEGAETPEHCAMLVEMGCDAAQGYGIARPMPASELPLWVRRFEPHPLWRSGIPA